MNPFSSHQVCFGAVQRSLLADVYSSDAGSPVLPACPLGGAYSDVQHHSKDALALQGLCKGQKPIRDGDVCFVCACVPPFFRTGTRGRQSSSGDNCLIAKDKDRTRERENRGRGSLCTRPPICVRRHLQNLI